MQILIKQCSDRSAWYAGLVGQRATLVRKYRDAYLVIDPEGFTNYIPLADADVLKEDRT